MKSRNKLSSRKLLIVEVIIVVTIVSSFIIYDILYIRNINDYISDECWYVSASRNILEKVFGLTPKFHGDNVIVTIELIMPLDEEQYHEWVADVKEFIIYGLKGRVLKDENYYSYNDGNYLPAVCAEIPKDSLKYINTTPHMKQYALGYCYPNANGILDYLNLEHPPLVKYIIALALMFLGDEPLFWRLPSIITAALILVLMYLALRRIIPEYKSAIILGAVAIAATVFDITFRSLSMVAMLDIFVAFFTYLTYYMALNSRAIISLVSLGLSASSKFNGAFPFLAVLAKILKDRVNEGRLTLIVILISVFLLPIAIFTLLSLPLINYLGLKSWVDNSVVGAIKWHLSIKTLGGPPQSAPWEWFLGINPFPLHLVYNANTGQWVADLIAKGNPPLYLLVLSLSILLIPVFHELPDEGFTYIYTWTTYLFYVLIWFLGARTQYSFYMVQLVPLLYTLLFIEVWYIVTPPKRVVYILHEWRRILWRAYRLLTKTL